MFWFHSCTKESNVIRVQKAGVWCFEFIRIPDVVLQAQKAGSTRVPVSPRLVFWIHSDTRPSTSGLKTWCLMFWFHSCVPDKVIRVHKASVWCFGFIRMRDKVLWVQKAGVWCFGSTRVPVPPRLVFWIHSCTRPSPSDTERPDLPI